MLYILDTNIFIYPHKVTHPFDIHPTFWAKMSTIVQRRDVISIDKVKEEIFRHEDNLTDWCKNTMKATFWAISRNSILEYAEIQNWAQKKGYNDVGLADFANSKNADAFLAAYALNLKRNTSRDAVIVTLEVSSPQSKKRVKLPDVCHDFGIRSINMNEFFREIKVSF